VIEFDAPQVSQTVRDLGNRRGLRIEEVHLLLSGFCSACQDREKKG
jgi:Fe2+ or Zn2+ uptake regulation protein